MGGVISQIGLQRLDWFGFGVSSANRTGAFIACLIIAIWILFSFRLKWLSALAWIASIGLFYFLVQTASRGAIISLVCAGIFFLYFSGLKFEKNTVLSVLLWCICAIFFFSQSRLPNRMGEMLAFQSSSANCRMDIYISGLKMLTDAPYGLEDSESPIGLYMKWYQSVHDPETYLSMINSHLEFLCANSLVPRFVYICLWTLAFILLFPYPRDIVPAACSSVWICFALCAMFSNVANYWALWIVPLSLLLIGAYYNRERLKKSFFYFSVLLVSLTAFVALHIISYLLPKDAPLRFYRDGDVLVGEGKPHILLFGPSEKILGAHYGKEIANIPKNKRSSTLVSSNLPRSYVDKLIISSPLSEGPANYNAKEIIFLNVPPPAGISKYSGSRIISIVGTFSDWRTRRAWENIVNKNGSKIELRILEGVADYVPNWTELISDEAN